MYGNFKSGRTGRALDGISRGLGSLGSGMSRFNRAMRGYNPVTGRTNTQSQYEAARDARRTQSRIDNMLARKAAGKSYSQKNPGQMIQAMAMFEVFYSSKLWSARKSIERYKNGDYLGEKIIWKKMDEK